MLPVDYEGYAFDLSHSNKYDDPRWYKVYNAKDHWKIPDLSPASFFQAA